MAPLSRRVPGLLAAFASATVCLSPAFAAPPDKPTATVVPAPPTAAKDPQSSFEPRTGPGEGQKLMARMVGEWDVVKSIFPVGKDPVRTKGVCHQMLVNEGRFLHSQFTFESKDGSTNVGVGILGFDAKTSIFTSVWIDSRSTAFSFRQSEGTFDGERVVLFGRSLDSKTPSRASRTIALLSDKDNTLIHQQFVAGPDGKERVIMELRMTRQKK